MGTLQPQALSEVERKELRRVLNSEEFVDEAPATIYAKLLDEGTYLASVPTMYRVLRDHDAPSSAPCSSCTPGRVRRWARPSPPSRHRTAHGGVPLRTEVHERRRQATHPVAKKPELLATKPNEVYFWDITKLLGPATWTYYYLYVILDVRHDAPYDRVG